MKKQSGRTPSGFRNVILLLLLSGMAALLVLPASADTSGGPGGKPVVTIIAQGSQSYYLGEKVSLSGKNTGSDSTYLFITGPNMPSSGGKLTSPRQAVVSGNPDTFTVVKIKPDATWEYSFYTANLPFDAGSYTLYAVSSPVAVSQFSDSTTYGTVSIILKKPFISAEISPNPVVRGKAFAVTGFAEGIPPEVQIWIIGKNYGSTAKSPVNQDASFTFTGTEAMSGSLGPGQYWLFVQHPMQNNQFDIVVSGDYVRNLKLNNGTTLFRLTGPGSLQGTDAAEALIAAFSDPEMTNEDTYTVIPFQVTDAGSPTSQATAATTAPVQSPTQPALLPFALIGAVVLVLGIVMWKRH
ncbi:MAG: hypothetical protein ABSG49_08785 [Methanoregula sp.]|jgi:hypothetical protein|uniref:hypothetical protein n=1 Tax=Methanoregula sp. TaxID=2052170 RepID=UPI003C18EEF0